MEECSDLAVPVPVWSKVGTPHEAVGPNTSANVSAAGSEQYYRVVGTP